jgi:hypothetical protein
MVSLPIRPVIMPASLNGQLNGRLDLRILTRTAGQAGGYTVLLVSPAHRSWRALQADARRHGHILKLSGPTESYRTYAEQLAVWLRRMTTRPNGTMPVYWSGRWWYKHRGVPVVARPGTSKHGWALALDLGEERDGDDWSEPMDTATLTWLVNHELLYGFSHEIPSETWHIRYVAGDLIPAATLRYEAGHPSTPPPPPRPTPVREDTAVTIFSVTDVGKNFCIMPDGPVELSTAETVDLVEGGMEIVGMKNPIFQRLVRGKRYTSFVDTPDL